MHRDDDAQGRHHHRPADARSTVTGTATDAAPSDISSRGAGPAAAAHLGELAAQHPRVGDGVPGLPGELAQHLLDDVVAARGEQHLADAGGVQRQPAADLADHRHRLAAGDPLDVQRPQPLPDGEVHGVPGGGVHVEQERRGDLAQLELHRGEQAEVPELPADLVAAVGPRGPAPPRPPARPSSRWVVVSGVPGALGDLGEGQPGVRGVEGVQHAQRPGGHRAPRRSPLHPPPSPSLLSSGSPGLGSVVTGPYGPGMTGTTSRPPRPASDSALACRATSGSRPSGAPPSPSPTTAAPRCARRCAPRSTCRSGSPRSPGRCSARTGSPPRTPT